LKKPLIVFFVSFGLSIAFTFLPLITSTVGLRGSIAESISINTLLGLFFGLVGLSLFFAIFYFLANNNAIVASKTTIIALLLGVTLGAAMLHLLNILLYQSYLGLYLNMAVDSSISGVFQFFFPALTALLFAELRKKKSINNMSA
jgi:hypothetical protein